MVLSPKANETLGEFLGVFLLCVTIPLASIGAGTLAPVPIGFFVCALVFTFGYVSQAHFNPAMSLAFFLVGQCPLEKMVRYMITHVLASICAYLYGTLIAGYNFPVPTTNNSLIKIWQGFLAELVYTFALGCVSLHVSLGPQKGNGFYGFAIGMTVLAAAFSVGGFTGGAFNPAVATGSQLVRCLTGDCTPLYHVWLYWAAPCLGGFIAAVLYNVLDTGATPPPAIELKTIS